MRAVTWHDRRDVRVEDVPDPRISEPTDVTVEITSTGTCGPEPHLCEGLGGVDATVPLLLDGDPLGVDDLATHRVPLEEAPDAYAAFQAKQDGAVKILLQP